MPKGILPTDSALRKKMPIYSGVMKFFPRSIAYLAYVSYMGSFQHHPGKGVVWDRSKSGDELDALMRHAEEAGGFDKDNVRHSGKVAWRGLANLEKELEAAWPSIVEMEKELNGSVNDPPSEP